MPVKFGQFDEEKDAPKVREIPKPGEVVVQWRCRGKHEGCEFPNWTFHSLIEKANALRLVEAYNSGSRFFDYRIKL